MSMMSLKVGSNEWKQFMINTCGVPEKFCNYLATGFHFQFEDAEKRQDIEWFKHFSKKHQDFMDFHANLTFPTFEWNCYRTWRGKDDPCIDKAKIMSGSTQDNQFEGLMGEGVENVYIF